MNAAAPSAPPAKRSLLPVLLISTVLSAASSGGVWYMTSHAKPAAEGAPAAEAAKPAAPRAPIYHALTPAFVVNLADTDMDRYLQLEVQLMTRDPALEDLIELHGPQIRNRLLLLFGQQSSEDLRRRVDKERLQREALAEVQAILKAETGSEGIEALYFTSFVAQ